MNPDVVMKSPAIYDPLRGYYTLSLSRRDKEELLRGRRDKFRYLTFPTNTYNFADLPNRDAYTKAYKQYSKDIRAGAFDRFFGNRTFGTEVETCIGSIPEFMLPMLGIVPLHDGSIRGHEYVTVPFEATGLVEKLGKIFDAAIENTRADEYCSLHYHIGNVRTDSEFLVAFYELYRRIQDELDLLNPLYKRDATYMATKRDGKDHCKVLPDLGLNELTSDQAWRELLKFYHEGALPKRDSSSGLYVHAKAGRPKWEHLGRYYVLNYLPTLFEAKHTIEFRVPSGTVNKYRGIAWLFIFNAMLTYCENNIPRIMASRDKILLRDVLEQVYCDGTEEGAFLFEYLMSYVLETKKTNRASFATRDLFGNHFEVDHKFRYELGSFSPFNFK